MLVTAETSHSANRRWSFRYTTKVQVMKGTPIFAWSSNTEIFIILIFVRSTFDAPISRQSTGYVVVVHRKCLVEVTIIYNRECANYWGARNNACCIVSPHSEFEVSRAPYTCMKNDEEKVSTKEIMGAHLNPTKVFWNSASSFEAEMLERRVQKRRVVGWYLLRMYLHQDCIKARARAYHWCNRCRT